MAGKSIALLAGAFVTAGCGSAGSHSTTPSSVSLSGQPPPDPALVTPRQLQRTFSLHGVRLVANYPNARPGPIVLADYRIVGKQPNGWATVFHSAHDAAAAARRSRKAYGKRNLVVRANLLVEFLRDTDRAARQQITRALSAVAG